MKQEQACAAGLTLYRGNPCNKCGGVMRYASNAGCVKCLKRSVVNRRARLKLIRKAAKGKRS